MYTYRDFIATFLRLSTCWYIHIVTLYQFSCKWTRDDIYIPQLYINFSADKHLMIYTYRNFISIILQINTWWYIHTATLYQFSCRWTRDDIYIPQLYINFPADNNVMIYTYRNCISIFLQLNTWWYIHTATLYQFSCSWTRDDIYIPQLCINFPADEHVMIYTYCNFIWTLLLWTPDDIYTLQLYINFGADEHGMIYTYRNFISTFLQMNTFWYIHTTTVYQFWSRWTCDDKYIPQLYISFPADEHVMICTYRNFISTFQQMNTWWYVHTATLYQLSCRWTLDDIYIP